MESILQEDFSHLRKKYRYDADGIDHKGRPGNRIYWIGVILD
jgi:hypothetical protein